jgi:hypothetical protein
MFYDAKQAARTVVADSMGSAFWGDMGDPFGRLMSFFLPGFPEFSKNISHAQADVLRAYVALLNAQIERLDAQSAPAGAGSAAASAAPQRVVIEPSEQN